MRLTRRGVWVVRLTTLAASIAAGFGLGWATAPSHADVYAVNGHWTPGHWVQPYGGCEEATLAPTSVAADQCRDHGWTIMRRLAVNPHAVLAGSGLPPCLYEDGSRHTPRCIWRGDVRGNGEGMTLWYDVHGNRHYVWPVSPIRYNVGPPIRWATVAPECIRQNHHVACPDGQVIVL